MLRIAATVALWMVLAVPAWAITGNLLPLNSGSDVSTNAQLDNNGYAGTYITLPSPGNVTVTVNASGAEFGGVNPRMNIVLADTKAEFDVATSGSGPYSHVFENMPAGTYFVRTEFANDGATSRALTINSLDVDGAPMLNSMVDADLRANALAAADTYIENFRQGPSKVALVGVEPGTEVEVSLKQHAFNWGANFRGTTVTPNPGTNQQDVNFYLQNPAYVEFFKQHFNMVVPSNAGKWSSNEGTRDMSVTTGMAATDAIMDFADSNDIRNRMHNLIWATQQPNWANTMLGNPASTDTYNAGTNPQGTNLSNLNALYSDLLAPAGTPNAGEPSEIHERISYYVGDGDGDQSDGDRARRYTEVDVYNESWHTGVNTPGSSSNYWDRYGASGISDIYKDVAQAVAAAGSSAKVYVNEYNILQNGNDSYGNWFRSHVDDIQNADGNPDGPIEGIGMQYYALPGHSTAYMQQVLQNMSVGGLQLSLTEFGVQETADGGATVVTPAEEAAAALILNESLRMMFGTPQATSFLIWGWGDGTHTGNLQRNSALVRSSDWTTLTLPGEEYEDLLGIADHDGNPNDGWTTNLTTMVGPEGTIDFSGFYGDYEITIDGVTYDLALVKGDTLQSIVVAPGDYNGDSVVDAADYTVWRNSLEQPGNLRADGNGDEVVNEDDYNVWFANYGNVYDLGGGGLASVPEPASAVLLVVGACLTLFRRRGQDGRAI